MTTRAVIMAAGKGTRMKSRLPKVLHELCGLSMFEHVLNAVRAAGADDIIAVVSADLEQPIGALGVRCVVQEPQNGTGHAMQLAMAALSEDDAQILVASGDMPLVPGALLRSTVAARLSAGAAVAMVTARVPLPTNFGRILRDGDRVTRIVEDRDASEEQKRIDEVNAAIYCFDSSVLRRHLSNLKPDNDQGELYLTDCIAAIVRDGGTVVTVPCEDRRLVVGVNNRKELAAARAVMQERILDAFMRAGVTVVDPACTYVDASVVIGNDTTLLPQTHLRGKTRIGTGCRIGPNSMLTNAVVGDDSVVTYSVMRDSEIRSGVTVGPFAHLRGGAIVEDSAHIGNFVELKNTSMGRGTKAGHLAYLGDADIGEKTNIGAGTITCNFDGKKKHKTKIGKGVFIGTNTSLIAPVTIGDGALTAAGAVVNRDVLPGERVAGVPAKPLKKKENSA